MGDAVCTWGRRVLSESQGCGHNLPEVHPGSSTYYAQITALCEPQDTRRSAVCGAERTSARALMIFPG